MAPRSPSALRLAAFALLAAPLFAVASPPAAAQYKLQEDFEDLALPAPGQQGPQALIDRGWTFRNQAQPLGAAAFKPGSSPGWPQSGGGFLGAPSTAAGMFGAKVSSWAILPPVAGQTAGDLLSIWVLDGGYPPADTFFEVRYSPSGGTGTGSGPFDVGDFTVVLFSGELPLASQYVYQLVSAALPGAGRVALRFHIPAISNFQTVANLYLDALTVGGAPPPACGLTLPAPGQTLVWDAGGSPYTVCQSLVVPAGATLVLAPGTRVEFDDPANLLVEGTLLAQGTAAAPVELVGDNVHGLRILGEARLEHVDARAAVEVATEGSLEVFDSSFSHQAWLSTLGRRSFVRLVRCQIGSEVIGIRNTSVWEDVVIPDATSYVDIRGSWRIEGLTSSAPLIFGAHLQDRAIENVTVIGAPGPALELHAVEGAVDFHLAPSNVLQGNQYPVWPRFAGLTPDSSVPATGNLNDAIRGFQNLNGDLRIRPSVPDFGLPYDFLERGTAAGIVQIAPGTLLRFGPEGGLSVTADRGQDPILRGLPGAPIRFERLFPGQEWRSVATMFGLTLFEHLDIDGAGNGVVSNAELLLRDCTISSCSLGAHPAGDGHIFGTGVRFFGNQLGLQNDTTNLAAQISTGIHFDGAERPNVFEGNVLAARNVPTTNGHLHHFPAQRNWWGHPTGPFEPLFHPQGQGDEVSFGVDFQGFLTSAPDLSDERPVVRLKTRLHPAILPGEKIFIEWDAFDDGTIVEFDLQVLTDDINAPYQTYVDLLSDLPGSARRCEVVVPDVGLHPYERFPFRIVATDDAGNVGFEQFQLPIPHQVPAGTGVFHTPLNGYQGGEDLEICYDAIGFSSAFVQVWVETAADDRMAQAASGSTGADNCTFGSVRIPFASTDRARLALRGEDNFNRLEYYFSDYFEIRPDPRLGDAPPTVSMLAPLDGQAFFGPGVLPIAWDAADDIGLREFRIQASFNGGYSFHTVAASLPPDARSHDWILPATTGVDDLRVRVVAVDTLMQNSSDGDARVLRVLPTRGRAPGPVSKPPKSKP